jgi:DNA-binding NtrC family response regulator
MKNSTVLLVFEELQDLENYGSVLCTLGCTCRLCSSVAEGIKALQTENFSLVIVSQGSPAFGGRQVLERSLQLHPRVPVLIVARALNVHCYLDAMDLGATE